MALSQQKQPGGRTYVYIGTLVHGCSSRLDVLHRWQLMNAVSANTHLVSHSVLCHPLQMETISFKCRGMCAEIQSFIQQRLKKNQKWRWLSCTVSPPSSQRIPVDLTATSVNLLCCCTFVVVPYVFITNDWIYYTTSCVPRVSTGFSQIK